MDKTLGQIAFEACDQDFMKWSDAPDGYRHQWEKMAAAVAAAVKEEDAGICDALFAEEAALAAAGVDAPKYHDAIECGAAIRASIKTEVK